MQWLASAAPDTSDPASIVDFILRGGTTGLLIAGFVLFLRGDIVRRGELEKAERQRDEFRDIVYRQFGIASTAVDVSQSRLAAEEQLATHLAELLRRERDDP